MKISNLSALFVLINFPLFPQSTGFFDDFEDGSVDTIWNDSIHTLWKADHPGTFGISEDSGFLNIAYTRTAESGEWDNFNFTPPDSIDVSANPVIILKIKSDVATTFTVKPIYSNGNDGWLQKQIPADAAWHVYTYQLVESNYTGGTLQKIYLYFDGGSTEEKSGLVQFDDFQIAGFSISVFNLTAQLVDTSKIDLSWATDDLENTGHFNVYRSLEGGFTASEETRIGETTDTLYHDSLLVNHTTYHYQVSATDIDGREHPPAAVSIRTSTPGAVPGVEILSVNADPVGKYEKFEVMVRLEDATYQNPYNPEEIDLFAWFYSPDGDSVRMNGFYDNYMGRDEWKIRFAARQAGSWHYRVFARDLDGTGSTGTQSFTVAASQYKGWLHISPDNRNYLMYDDGTSFYGMAVYYPWNVRESRLDDFAAVNGNLFGYWDCTYDNAGNGGGRYLLESMESGVGRYDQRKAARIDEVLSWAEARDMKVMLAIWVHPYLRIEGVPWDNGQWYEENPYSSLVGVDDFYTDSLALSYQEKHHRYLIARWGYSRALGIWEIINEMHGTTGWVHNEAAAKKWVETVHAYFKENDPFHRPTTASFGGIAGASYYSTTDQLGDIPNVHFYEQHGWSARYPDNLVRSGLANVVGEAGKLKSKGDRPAFLGEAGYTSMLADTGTTAYAWEFHNAFWAGLANGLASTPFWWEFNQTGIFTPVSMQDYRILDKFAAGIDLAHLPFTPASIHAVSVDGYYMGTDTTGFGWMETYDDTAISNAPVYITGTELDNGTYRFEWFNTWTGDTAGTDTAVCVEGITWGEVPGDAGQKDIAFRFRKLEDGTTATHVRLFVVKTDTLVAGMWPWSPKVDSTLYSIVCYVTDDDDRLDVSFNGPVDIEMVIEGETAPHLSTRNLEQGGTVFDYEPAGSAGATITATAEGLGTAVLYIAGVTGIDDNEGPAEDRDAVRVSNYPNPFEDHTTISYMLPAAANIKLTVYDLNGEAVEVLVNEHQPAGQHSVVWQADPHPAGVYFYTLFSGRTLITRRCVLLK